MCILPSSFCENQEALTYEKALQILNFGENERKSLENGQVQAKELQPHSDKELAVSVAMIIDKPLTFIYEALHQGQLMKHTTKFLDFEQLDADPLKKTSFKQVKFQTDEKEELENFLQVHPGTKYNLSKKEIDRIKNIRKQYGEVNDHNSSFVAQELSQLYQTFLFERFQNYLEHGTDQIPPYAREEGKTHPGKELNFAIKESELLHTFYPDFCHAFHHYPNNQKEHYEHRYYWLKQRIQERPNFALTHRMFYQGKKAAIYAERHFYAGHSYNSMQVVGGGLPFQNKTFLFGIYRLFTDQITGFLGGMKQEFGEALFKNNTEIFFERLKNYLTAEKTSQEHK